MLALHSERGGAKQRGAAGAFAERARVGVWRVGRVSVEGFPRFPFGFCSESPGGYICNIAAEVKRRAGEGGSPKDLLFFL